jgi:sugar O-acyltransferase (sialic acid O-acetyltransferase NeuD family)
MTAQTDGFVLWGAGGHGRVVADLVASLGFRVHLVVDRAPAAVRAIHGVDSDAKVMSEADFISAGQNTARVPQGSRVALGIGDNALRLQALRALGAADVPALVHPGATVSKSATIGRGSVVFAGAIVNADARIGEAVIINTGAVIEHDCVVADGAHISPGAVLAGAAAVGRESWVGAAAVVLPGVRIGDGAMIGAGAVVLHNVQSGATAVGNPAHILRSAT